MESTLVQKELKVLAMAEYTRVDLTRDDSDSQVLTLNSSAD